MTTHHAATATGLPKSTIRPIASDARQLFHLLDSAVEKLRTAPEGPEICRLQKDLGPLLGTSRDLAQNAVVSLELDRDYEAAMQPLRSVSGQLELTRTLEDIETDLRHLHHLLDAAVCDVLNAPRPAEMVPVLDRISAFLWIARGMATAAVANLNEAQS